MNKNFPEILVLRHGQTEWNAQHKMQGRLNSPLTKLGRGQAHQQNQILSPLNLSGFQFFSSPQGRAFQTAAIALNGIADLIETHPDLCEIDMDIWSGHTIDQVFSDMGANPDDYSAMDIYNFIPGGEGLCGLYARCARFMEGLTGPAVIVTHGITSRCLRLVATGQGIENLMELPGGQGNVYRVKNGIHALV